MKTNKIALLTILSLVISIILSGCMSNRIHKPILADANNNTHSSIEENIKNEIND